MTEIHIPARKSGRRPRFSADDVVATALRLGIGTFSITAVSRELGVTNAAVYRRYPSHRALVDECLSQALSEVSPPIGAPDREQTLRAAAADWWAVCLRHPGIDAVVAGGEDAYCRLATGPFVDHARHLVSLGLTPDQANFALTFMFAALGPLRPEPDPAQFATRLDVILTGLTGAWNADTQPGERCPLAVGE
ncbi:TetR/AcrR family transcriptional regulator [Corynebacterium terpenotabidum]|uniref:TetR family transcriptional regulator n=1 Tax=Corynebacterium terpenotabidum Y-11 TaxID=1200352 RepID=S4XCJ7_9CORY|nr:TetR/AcrR family transcriptional regulator [Corynebacterium terpenotabidum]AGP30234.1 TetR family transcriptional regulator [Corynebacterium terpenotabidum Y-11]